MALIPADAGIRMRMQTEANLLQPVTPAHEIPSDLPELRPGQTFTARIQEVLPDNSYKALVAGKQLTLQLPEGAKAGDQLELVVIDRSPRVVIAKQVEGSALASGEALPYEFAKFSPAARMIGQLLPAEGEAAEPAQLNRGQPLMAAPPQTQAAASRLAPALARAVSQSGVFYESHQAQWATGQRPLADLLQEPQGQRSTPTAFQHAAAAKVDAGETVAARALPTATAPAGTTPSQPMPDDLRPLVQQQLEAVATHRLAWHGEVWPRQAMDWEVEWEGARTADDGNEDAARWNTSLSLTTPRLGRIDAMLQLSGEGVRITLATPYGASAADLRDESPQLVKSLAATGVPLINLQIRHEDEHPARQG